MTPKLLLLNLCFLTSSPLLAAQEPSPDMPTEGMQVRVVTPRAATTVTTESAPPPPGWVEEHLPRALVEPGFRGWALWQWLALLPLLLVSYLLGRMVTWVVTRVLGQVARRTASDLDDKLLQHAHGPLVLALGALSAIALLPLLRLRPTSHDALHDALRSGIPLALAWAVLRSVDVFVEGLAQNPYMATRPAIRALLPFSGRFLKVVVVILTVVSVIQGLGYPVTSLVAGLGLGGLVVALAAQKTLENFFGSISLGVDQPFRPGDFVKIDDFLGTVEVVGLRSTRVRTLDRTLITIPNGKLADMRTENFSVRDRIRLSTILGLTYGTTAEQLRAILTDVEALLRAHPLLHQDDLTVRFRALGAYSLDVEVMAWFKTTDFNAFMRIREEVLLGFMEIVARHGSSFAFPTQTNHVVMPR
ncbi:MAG: mechanosensitive ion channel family protein [Myxococcota bacterium]